MQYQGYSGSHDPHHTRNSFTPLLNSVKISSSSMSFNSFGGAPTGTADISFSPILQKVKGAFFLSLLTLSINCQISRRTDLLRMLHNLFFLSNRFGGFFSFFVLKASYNFPPISLLSGWTVNILSPAIPPPGPAPAVRRNPTSAIIFVNI